ncbi:MAG: TonB-dependent receptor [Pseudomonadales bacterium]|nr:TonB-dependent receptor [Pseudomonadales bacterium]
MNLKNLIAVACVATAGAPTAHSQNERPIEEVVVVAHPLSGEGLAQASSTLDGEKLRRSLGASLGTTVERTAGIHNSSFGEAAGRPVIHGLSGPRVRVMEDRIDLMDVSTTSADHATMVDPFIAESIEILKGPSTLLYGSGAIGGVVDVHTGRVPHDRPEAWTGRIDVRAADNANHKSFSGRLDATLGNIVWHLDGFSRSADDYDIPGFAESDILHESEQHDEDHEDEDEHGEHEEEERVRGKVPGSDFDVDGGALGLSWVGDRGFVGFAVSTIDGGYGLPGEHGHHEEEHAEEDEHEEEGQPVLELEQTRIDFEAALTDPFAFFDSLNVRVGYNDYQHEEIEPSGEVGTRFENEAWEGRLELIHGADRSGRLNGVLGLQLGTRDFEVSGEEAYVPPVDTDTIGVFWVGEFSFDLFDLETGVRFGQVEHHPSNQSGETFDTWAASLGVVLPLGESWQIGLQGDLSSRAPVAEELYSNGPHLATGFSEIGERNLDEEQAFNLSATLSYTGERLQFSVTGYRVDFSDYIFQMADGTEVDELPVLRYGQSNAEYVGVDFEANFTAIQWDNGSLNLSALYDRVSAELDVRGNDNVPQLPTERVGVGAALEWGPFLAMVDYLMVDDRTDVTEFELPTQDYEDLRVTVEWALMDGDDGNLTLFAQGRNLTNEEQRNHTSLIKDVAPRPGRTIEVGLRASF